MDIYLVKYNECNLYQNNMKNERQNFLDQLLIYLLYSYLIFAISSCAARSRVRHKVRERAGSTCENCNQPFGENEPIVAHMDHSKNGGHYHNPANLKAYCHFCETEYHIQHVGNPTQIGMTRKNNDSVSWGHFLDLTPGQQEIIESRYETELRYLRDKYDFKSRCRI